MLARCAISDKPDYRPSTEHYRDDQMSSEPHVTNHNLVAAFEQCKGAEQALHESEKLIYAILDNSPNLVFLKDARGRYLLVNQQFERAFGIERKQIEGKTD